MEFYSTTRSEKCFKDPLEMKPERWLRENKDEQHAFSNLQFGFGPRMCLGEKNQLMKAWLFIKESFCGGTYGADS